MAKNSSPARRALGQNALVLAVSIVAAFLVSMIFILALGVSPVDAFVSMFRGALTRKYGLAEVLAKATPLIIIGVGVALAARGGMSNLGGDGQFYIGAICSICVGLFLPPSTPALVVWVLALIVGILSGGFWGGLSGWLKAKFNTSEVIITIMLNYVALYLMGWLVHGPLQAPGGIPQTQALEKSFQLPKIISGTRAHAGIFIALASALLVWWIFKKTTLGYRIQTVGESPDAAVYAGIKTNRYMSLIMALSGAFAGMAGMVEVYGVHYRVLEGISSSFGFTAMLIALLAKLNPLAVVIGSLFISALTVGANSMQIDMSVPTSIVNVVQSLIIFFMLITPAIKSDLLSSISKKRHKKEVA